MAGPLLTAGLLLIAWVVLSTQGLGPRVPPVAGVLASCAGLVQAGVIPALYMLGAFGLGRLALVVLARTGGARDGRWAGLHTLQLVLGLGCMLLTSQLLGLAGWLSGNSHSTLVAAWAPVAVGLGVLLDQLVRGDLRPENWPVLPRCAALWSIPVALTGVAAVSPPGWLWESEFGGYDAMSYHLQLPKEWATSAPEGVGRLWPVAHNVYSYLPSYLEGAFLHVGAMTPASALIGSGAGLSASERLVGGEGTWLLSCQLLHAMTGLVAAVTVARCVRVTLAGGPYRGAGDRQVEHSGFDQPRESGIRVLGSFVAGGVLLATPWAVVVGSLAYNEMAMLALLAGAMLAAVELGLIDLEPKQDRAGNGERRRGQLRSALVAGFAVGALVGLACSVKPTALVLGAPVVGIWLLALSPVRRWAYACGGGVLGGVVVMLPWLARNAVESGNPVFPFAPSVLGLGHWTAQQAATYALNHAPSASPLGAIGLLIGERGFGHLQWSWSPVLAVVFLLAAGALVDRPLRRVCAALGLGMLLQIMAWALLTHQQSRFLMPVLLPMSIVIGLGSAAIGNKWGGGSDIAVGRSDRDSRVMRGPEPRRWARGFVSILLALVPISLATESSLQFLSQRDGVPNAHLVPGPGVSSGLGLAEALAQAPLARRREFFDQQAVPDQVINLYIHPGVLAQVERRSGEDATGWREGGRAAPGAKAFSTGDSPPGRGVEEEGAVYLLGDATPVYLADATGGPGARVVYHTTWDRSLLGDAIRARGDADPAGWTEELMDRGIGYVLVNVGELARLIDKDRYYDADVSGERVKRWIESLSRPAVSRMGALPQGATARGILLKAWPGEGRALYRLLRDRERGEWATGGGGGANP